MEAKLSSPQLILKALEQGHQQPLAEGHTVSGSRQGPSFPGTPCPLDELTCGSAGKGLNRC